ncbi:MAG: DUF2284 domain-containing protein, partial [Lachnospiraceae bacterium]|nr:DUF2284 domain-containing protein [Lachnospiraceae bacterium]
MEKWMDLAKKTGFDEVGACDPGKLICEEWVREGCAENRCRAYGRNWTCPPACGTLEECNARIHACSCGILLQTIGHMKKSIDSRCYRETEHRHLTQFRTFAAEIRRVYP